MQRRILALALAGALSGAFAQVIPDVLSEWKETEAPPPPALRTQGLIPVDVRGSTLKFGIDPASITIGPDQVVRYVVVATGSGGAVNAIYEGIRCSTAQVKVYARHNPDSGWVPTRNPDWEDLQKSVGSRYSMAIARGGACREHTPNRSPSQIAQDLRSPADRRFEPGGNNR